MNDASHSVVGRAVSDESAALHVSGRATYIDDIPVPAECAHGVLALTTVATGAISSIDVAQAREQPGVLAVLTADDIPGENSHAPRAGVDPILTGAEVSFAGQPFAMVLATSRRAAERAAALVRATYEVGEPVLDPRTARELGQHVVEPMHMEQPTEEEP